MKQFGAAYRKRRNKRRQARVVVESKLCTLPITQAEESVSELRRPTG